MADVQVSVRLGRKPGMYASAVSTSLLVLGNQLANEVELPALVNHRVCHEEYESYLWLAPNS
jgi:hypothetical protein